MRKLSLKNLNFGANDLLDRNQLKTVFGGYGGNGGNGICYNKCSSDSDCDGPGGSANPYCNDYDCDGETYKQCSAA